MRSKKGYVYGDKIVQEDGTIYVKDSFPIEFRSAKRGPQLKQMLVPKDNTLTDDISKGIITFQAKDIKIEQDGIPSITPLSLTLVPSFSNFATIQLASFIAPKSNFSSSK